MPNVQGIESGIYSLLRHYAYNTNLYVLAILRLCIVELHSGTALRTQSLLLLAIRHFGVVQDTGCPGFSLRILVAGERCNVTGEYFESGSTSE